MKDQKRSPIRIHPMDVAIVVLALLLAVGLALRVARLDGFQKKEELEVFKVRFSVSNIAASSVSALAEGDTLTLTAYGQILGALSHVESVTPAVVYLENERREIVRAQYPEGTRVDVVGVVTVRGAVGESGFLLNGAVSLSPGIEYQVQSEHMDFQLKILL